MYAKADLYGMGKGIFPKDKVPTLPVHPNCMCRLIPVYEGSPRLKSETPKDRKLDGGMEYIKQLPAVRQKSLLGINGLQMVKRGADWRQYARGYSDKVMTSRIVAVQEYRIPEIGEAESAGAYKGTPLTVCPILNSSYDLAVVPSIPVKPKMIHTIEKKLRETGELMGIAEADFPKVIITNEELKRAIGAYQSVDDRLLFNTKIFDRDWADKNLGGEIGQLETIAHELYHWKDAKKYIAKHGKITDAGKYIAELCMRYKRLFDKLVASGYDVNSVSGYASSMYDIGRYDEFFTEYRAKELLKRRRK